MQFGLDQISRYLTNADPVEAIFLPSVFSVQGSPPHDRTLTVERQIIRTSAEVDPHQFAHGVMPFWAVALTQTVYESALLVNGNYG